MSSGSTPPGMVKIGKVIAGVSLLAGAVLALLGLNLFGGFGVGTGTGKTGTNARASKTGSESHQGAIVLRDQKIFLDGREITFENAKAHLKSGKSAQLFVHGSALAVDVSRIKAFCDEEKIQYSSTVVSDR